MSRLLLTNHVFLITPHKEKRTDKSKYTPKFQHVVPRDFWGFTYKSICKALLTVAEVAQRERHHKKLNPALMTVYKS